MMVRAAQRAGRGLLRDFGDVASLQVSRKGPNDFVSQADRKAEKTILEVLSQARPEAGFLMEESGVHPGQGNQRFIVDPLDGTLNFLHGLPHWCVSIAFEEEGQIKAGVVYDPVKDDLFAADRSGGAYLNDHRLRIAPRTQVAESLIAIGWEEKPNDDGTRRPAYRERVADAGAATRRFGAAALDLAYVAAGRFDGFYEVGLKPWDMAAGMLLVTESGGYASTITGEMDPYLKDSILVANQRLHGQLMKALAGKALS